MAELPQAEFGRAARGAPISPGLAPDVEMFILGMGQSARAAVRRVHSDTPDDARAYLAGKHSGFLLQGGSVAAIARAYRACLERYIGWDGQAAAAVATPTKGHPVPFAPNHIIKARPDVVLDTGSGHEARVLLWDDLPLDAKAAEMIALPIVGYVEADFGQGSVAVVSVWQLETGQQEAVGPAAAQARRQDVETLLASI